MTARRSWRTATESADFAGPARRIARWLAKHEARRFCAPETSPPGKGRHLTIDERGYISLLASDHLCRHSSSSPAGPCSAEPCQARGAAYALLEIVHFEDDERSDQLAAARDLFVGLEDFSRSLEKVEADLRTYLARASQRHKGSWANERSHDHKKTCLFPANLLLLLAGWKRSTASVKGTAVLSQFRSVTARARLGEGKRPNLLSTVEAILREDGWKLREILATVGGIFPGQGHYDDEFENLKKRLTGVRKIETAPVVVAAPSTAPSPAPAPSTASPTPHPSLMGVASGDGFAKAAFSVGEPAYSAHPSDGLATGKVTGEVMASATGPSTAAAVAPASDATVAGSPSDDQS